MFARCSSVQRWAGRREFEQSLSCRRAKKRLGTDGTEPQKTTPTIGLETPAEPVLLRTTAGRMMCISTTRERLAANQTGSLSGGAGAVKSGLFVRKPSVVARRKSTNRGCRCSLESSTRASLLPLNDDFGLALGSPRNSLSRRALDFDL